MKLGITMFGTDPSVSPADLAVMVEDRGFESLWFSEHSHIPASRETPWPGGADLPAAYWQMLDPMVALTAAGVVTERLKLGTGVCLVTQRDPIQLAKTVASIDVVTRGRFLFGIGVGWNREEMRNHGTDPRTRVTLMRERVEAMKQIWTQEEAEYHGTLVDFDPVWAEPKPVQRPHPPILIGGNTAKALPRVVAYGDEWMPHRVELDALAGHIAELQQRAAEAGREPIPVTSYGADADPRVLDRLADMGVHRAVLVVPAGKRSEVAALLDHHARLLGVRA